MVGGALDLPHERPGCGIYIGHPVAVAVAHDKQVWPIEGQCVWEAERSGERVDEVPPREVYLEDRVTAAAGYKQVMPVGHHRIHRVAPGDDLYQPAGRT